LRGYRRQPPHITRDTPPFQLFSQSSALCLQSAVRFTLRTPCGALEKLTVMNQPKDFDRAVGSEPIEDQVPWLPDLMLLRD
jgi:hypothetical protein